MAEAHTPLAPGDPARKRPGDRAQGQRMSDSQARMRLLGGATHQREADCMARPGPLASMECSHPGLLAGVDNFHQMARPDSPGAQMHCQGQQDQMAG
jgi:hypothetical protein